MDCSCAQRRLSLKACHLSQALCFPELSHMGSYSPVTLNKLLFALLKYRVSTLPPASPSWRGSGTATWSVPPRLQLIITPLTNSFSFVSSRARRALPLVGSSSICEESCCWNASGNFLDCFHPIVLSFQQLSRRVKSSIRTCIVIWRFPQVA